MTTSLGDSIHGALLMGEYGTSDLRLGDFRLLDFRLPDFRLPTP